MTLPSTFLRFGGQNFLDDEVFLQSGEKEAKRLQKDFGLKKEGAVLEIGCGYGRLPIGILSAIGPISTYQGVDVSDGAIQWCKRYISKKHPSFCFLHINAHNKRYNPKGSAITTAFRLPLADHSFDIIYLYSVFSHMHSDEIRPYLKEFRRLLTPTGKVFLTAFVEKNVADEKENPKGYKQQWKGALHCVRYSENFFRSFLAENGLRIHALHHGTETDGQSALYLSLT